MAAAATSILSLHNIPALADSLAGGATSDSPGVLSGNTVQAPVNVPVNVCGNSVNVVGLLNPAFGNSCGNQANPVRQTPEIPRQTGSSDTGGSQTPPPAGAVNTPPASIPPASTPPVRTPAPRPPARAEQPQRGAAAQERQDDSSTYRPRPMGGVSQPALAETGSGAMLATSGVSAALMAGGLILYRRGRAASYR